MAATLTKLREALYTKLSGDAALTTLLGGANIFYRPRKAVISVPSVTYFDFGTKPDPLVPLMDRTIQLDIWERSTEKAEEIAFRIRQLLDLKNLVLPGLEARPVYLHWQADRDIPEEEGDIAHKTVEYRLLAYELVA